MYLPFQQRLGKSCRNVRTLIAHDDRPLVSLSAGYIFEESAFCCSTPGRKVAEIALLLAQRVKVLVDDLFGPNIQNELFTRSGHCESETKGGCRKEETR